MRMILLHVAAIVGWMGFGAEEARAPSSWVSAEYSVSASNPNGETSQVAIAVESTKIAGEVDGEALEITISVPPTANRVTIGGIRLDVALDDATRLLRFESANGSCVIGPFVGRAESEGLLIAATPDDELLVLIHAEFQGATKRSIRIERGVDGSIEATLELGLPELGLAADGADPTSIRGSLRFARHGDAMAVCERVLRVAQPESTLARAGLESISHVNPIAALRSIGEVGAVDPVGNALAESRRIDVPVAARPLDTFRGEGVPHVWASLPEASSPSLVLVNPTGEALVVAVPLERIATSLAAGAIVTDSSFGEDLGFAFGGLVVALPPQSTRRLALRPAIASEASRAEVVLIHSDSPTSEAVVATLPPDDPGLMTEALRTCAKSGIVIVHLPGSGSLEPIPPAVAQLVVAVVAPHRAISRSTAPKGSLERFTKLASNLEFALGFPRQDFGSRDWLVCLEAGFLATPLQPRIVDGMTAARGFMLNLSPGALIVTCGFSLEERASFTERLRSFDVRLDALRRLTGAQLAVRLDQPTAGVFAGLSHLQRTRAEDLVLGDPIVLSRAAVNVPSGSKSRLRTLPAPAIAGLDGGGALTEDILEFSNAFHFAIDLPQPFVDPLLIAVRRLDDGADFVLSYEERPLDRLARQGDGRTTWCEEIYALRPEVCVGQVRVYLGVEARNSRARVARLGFYSATRGAGRGLAHVPAAGVIPGPSALARGSRLDGGFVVHEGKVFPNAIELAVGGKAEFELPNTDGARVLAATLVGGASAGPIDSKDGSKTVQFVLEVDGVERARYDLIRGGEPIAMRIDVLRAARISIACEAPPGSEGSVILIDPRLR